MVSVHRIFDRLMAEYVRQPRPVSVLLLDLDHFKHVNDQHGHAVGDQALRRVAAQLRQGLRKSDIALTVSVGVSQFSGNEPSEQTISRADAGLYLAKQGGRNRVCVLASPTPAM